MSVRAYIIRKFQLEFTKESMIFKKVLDLEPLFNVWHNGNIFGVFEDYGGDFTNHDANGEIMISADDWQCFKKDFKKEDWSAEELEILERIDDELKRSDDLWCECF